MLTGSFAIASLNLAPLPPPLPPSSSRPHHIAPATAHRTPHTAPSPCQAEKLFQRGTSSAAELVVYENAVEFINAQGRVTFQFFHVSDIAFAKQVNGGVCYTVGTKVLLTWGLVSVSPPRRRCHRRPPLYMLASATIPS